MKAMVLDSYGLHPKLKELPEPQAGEHEVRIRVKATSVNPIDWKTANGETRPVLFAKFPDWIPGFDVAGEIDQLGPNVKGFSVGQRVHARMKTNGANAELAIATTDVTCAMPEGMSFGDAAALPLTGMTALQGLRDKGHLRANEKVLVNGASGGVGQFAVQIARAEGAQVTGVCSARNEAMVRRLGAQQVIDYAAPNAFDAHRESFDLIFDAVGENVGAMRSMLKPGGRYVTPVFNGALMGRAIFNLVSRKKITFVLLSPNARDLAQLDALYAEKRLEVVIAERFPFNELPAAWERSRSGRAAGKIVIDW